MPLELCEGGHQDDAAQLRLFGSLADPRPLSHTLRKGMAIPRWWWSVGLPRAERSGTYELLPESLLPALAVSEETDWLWLPQLPEPLRDSISDPDDADAFLETAASARLVVPAAFKRFIANPRLRWGIRSATGCWWSLEAGATAYVPAVGATVCRFLTDQEDSLLWFEVLGGDGSAIVASEVDLTKEAPDAASIWQVAGSFPEFVHRFWLENEMVIARELGSACPTTRRTTAGAASRSDLRPAAEENLNRDEGVHLRSRV
jgi:hypothetical protein